MSNVSVVNEVKLAGTIKKIKAEAGRFFALVDVSQEKWVPCTAHEKDERGEKDLISNLLRFREGDSIVFKGYVRPWSMRDGDSWKNGMDIRITNLKPGSVPKREPANVQQSQQQNESGSW